MLVEFNNEITARKAVIEFELSELSDDSAEVESIATLKKITKKFGRDIEKIVFDRGKNSEAGEYIDKLLLDDEIFTVENKIIDYIENSNRINFDIERVIEIERNEVRLYSSFDKFDDIEYLRRICKKGGTTKIESEEERKILLEKVEENFKDDMDYFEKEKRRREETYNESKIALASAEI